ncbi:MAG: DUF523 domain-containing protein [Candidatus Omnitrophota bacterium]
MKLCSACLLGIKCRYDEKAKPRKSIIKLAKKEVLIPVCPEQLGGLPTPRKPSERKGKRIIMRGGKDVTKNFKKGTRSVLKIAKTLGIKEAIFKERSPACGSGGIATEILRKNGIKVVLYA